VNLRSLRRIAEALLQQTWPDGSLDLGIYVVAEAEMTRLNQTFLQHRGPTDVITFDYTEAAGQAPRPSQPHPSSTQGLDRRDAGLALLHGEIFVCMDEAISQARRFRTTWHSELVRYIVHGVLHLLGYDDLDARTRRKMKIAEDALVCQLAGHFSFRRLGLEENDPPA
jgi:probable rRNA maturation factor